MDLHCDHGLALSLAGRPPSLLGARQHSPAFVETLAIRVWDDAPMDIQLSRGAGLT